MKKRLFALLLSAIFLLMGLPITAAFTDEEQIDPPYQDAVHNIASLGIINGFPDGTFQPMGTLTREQAAKIVTFLLLGENEAGMLVCTQSPYSDVDVDRWSAPSIRYCTEHSILHGMGDGTYRPTALLTGPQFAKMLLCACKLGEPSRYIGDSWMENVVEDGMKAGLFEGDLSMSLDKALQRQQAALMVWNAIRIKALSTSAGSEEIGKDSSSSSTSTEGGNSPGAGDYSSGSSARDSWWLDFNPDEWFAPSDGNSSAGVEGPSEQQQPENGGDSSSPENIGTSQGDTEPAEHGENNGEGESGSESGGSELPFVPFDDVIELPEVP